MKRSGSPGRHALVAFVAVAAVLLTAGPAVSQQVAGAVDQKKVDAAVDKGAKWLMGRVKAGLPDIPWIKDPNHDGSRYHEIVLYTLLHADVPRDNLDLVNLLQETRKKPTKHVYETALRAMAFAQYSPKLMKYDLLNCAEYLVNNQGKNGQWDYGRPVPLTPVPVVSITRRAVASLTSGDKPSPYRSRSTHSTEAVKKMRVKRHQWGGSHDNSNTQYALLGLAAAMKAGIYPPDDTIQLAMKWWREAQNDDGGWGYQGKGSGSKGSMTAGALSSLAYLIRAQDGQPLDDPQIKRGIQWMEKHMRFDANPKKDGGTTGWHYYWIYSIERAGALAGTEFFGKRQWYPEGVNYLLSVQRGDGSWLGGEDKNEILDTCWAILFLRRATRGYAVASGTGREHK